MRAEFPALRNWTWLNTATFGQIPTRSRNAVDAHFARREETACADFLQWFDDMDELRALIAQLVHCDAQDIAFAMNAASALSLFLGGMDWRAGDRIVTLRDEFPNQYYFAASLAEQGVQLIEMDAIEALPERTRAVLVSTVNYSNGYRPDVARISQLAHEVGALVYVDGTQSIGALTFGYPLGETGYARGRWIQMAALPQRRDILLRFARTAAQAAACRHRMAQRPGLALGRRTAPRRTGNARSGGEIRRRDAQLSLVVRNAGIGPDDARNRTGPYRAARARTRGFCGGYPAAIGRGGSEREHEHRRGALARSGRPGTRRRSHEALRASESSYPRVTVVYAFPRTSTTPNRTSGVWRRGSRCSYDRMEYVAGAGGWGCSHSHRFGCLSPSQLIWKQSWLIPVWRNAQLNRFWNF